MTKRIVVYARISLVSEESVSIERQLHSGRRYAEARGWTVVGEYVDAGVSATQNKPENRTGWRKILDAPDQFDAVVIWKVDRLARRVIDFLHADAALQARSAAIVCVEQNIDMTTGEGRAFAQMLAVFGEMEAAAISSRMSAARSHLLQTGRRAGGVPLYGWRTVPNPRGPGKVLAHDPERIEWVRGMVARASRGDTIYSIVRWLDAENAPRPVVGQERRTSDRWVYSTVEKILANPLLAGMTLFNPGNGARGHGRDILRTPDGQPVIDHALAVIGVEQREHLLRLLANKKHYAAKDASDRVPTSPILARLVWCGHCDRLMHRRVISRSRGSMKCPGCTQSIGIRILAGYVEARLLQDRGELCVYARRLSIAGDQPASRRLVRIETDLRAAVLALMADGADSHALHRKIEQLKTARGDARRAAPTAPVEVPVKLPNTLADVWRLCRTDEQRRLVLASQIDRLVVVRGHRGGRYLDPARVALTWTRDTTPLVPEDISLEELYVMPRKTTAVAPSPDVWVSRREAARLLGCSRTRIDNAVAAGRLERRKVHHSLPSLSLTSVLALPQYG